MIVVRLMGGLGNQMFQYAAGLSLAKRLNSKLYIDLSWLEKQDEMGVATKRDFALAVFGIKTAGKLRLKNQIRLRQPIVLRDPDMTYNRDFAEVEGNIILEGFWQSSKYFRGAETEIRKTFTFPKALSANSQSFLKEIKNCQAVSVHVRRGDYANDANTNKFHGLLPLSYFSRAADIVKKQTREPRFFVFSDDPDWCQKNLNLGGPTVFVTGNSGARSYEDMQLMSACNHNIIVNSSFSWWGAWLNPNPDKIVIAPKKWWQDKALDSSDVVPKEWVKL